MLKKKLLCLTTLIVVCALILSGCSLFSHLTYLNGNTEISDVSITGYNTLAVGEDGNVYYRGNIIEHFTNGVSGELSGEINTSNFLMGMKFIRMYDKGDAVKAYLTTYGGAILTEQDEVYLFLNGDTEGYQTPTLFCSGYTDLEIYSDTVYLLSGKDEFGYMTVDSPGDFHILAENVRKFRFAVNNQNHVVAFLLMNDNRLYVYDTNESFNPDAEHFKNITDFDYCSKSTEFKVLCIQDSLCDVYYYVLSEEELSYEAIQTHSGEKTGENVAKITAYGTGVAMLDDDNNLYLYGGDMDRHYSREFTGEKVMANVSLVAGSSDSLFVVKTDGSYHYYGNNGDNTYNTIRKEE